MISQAVQMDLERAKGNSGRDQVAMVIMLRRVPKARSVEPLSDW